MLMVIPGSEVSRHAELMDRAFRFRHAVFVGEKGWEDLRQPDGLERDRFDDGHAVHQLCMRGDEIVGYQRLLPTTRPHLLTDVLGDLCRRRPPRGPRVFEWTRFCVAKGHREMRPCGESPFLELAQGVVEWGMASKVDTVTVAIEPVGGADFAALFGISVTELEARLKAEVEEVFNQVDPKKYLRAFANSEAFSSKGLGADYASNPSIFSVSVAGNATIDVGEWANSRFVLAGGQSGNPFSPHYADMLPIWQQGEGVPIAFTAGEVHKATVSELRLASA